MIFVVKKKHLNDFKEVHCVRPKDLYARLGHRQPDTNFQSSDEPISMNHSKIDVIQDMLSDYDRFMHEQAFKNDLNENDNFESSQKEQN